MSDFDEAMKSILEVMDLGDLSVDQVQELVSAGVAANIMHSLACNKDHGSGECDYYKTHGSSNARAYWRNQAIEKAKSLGFTVQEFGSHLQYVSAMLSRSPAVDYTVLQYVLTQIALRAPKRLASQQDSSDATDAAEESGSNQPAEP